MDRSSGWWVAGGHQHAEGDPAGNPRWSVVLRWVEWIGTATIFLSLGIIGAGLADRAPPYGLVDVVVPSGPPGAFIKFDARVWRDTGRKCSVTMYRSIFHSNGKRIDMDPQFFSDASIQAMEVKTPGRMQPEIQIPIYAEPGKDAYLDTRLRYVCNRYQTILPIDVHTVMPFVVTPP